MKHTPASVHRRLLERARFVNFRLDYELDPDLVDFATRFVEGALRGNLPFGLNNGVYSIKDSQDTWRALMVSSALHFLLVNEFSQMAPPGEVALHSVIRTTPRRLAERCSVITGVDPDAALAVISDMTDDRASQRIDLRSHPVISLGNDEIMICPQLSSGLKWDPCTHLLWAKRHSRTYGRFISSFKRELAQQLSNCFDASRFAVSAMRDLKDQLGQTIGDLDVAVLDRTSRHLLLIEVKWLVEPDDTLEMMTVDDRLLEGVAQARSARDYAIAHLAEINALLFPREKGLLTPTTVEACVLSRGAIGTSYVAGSNPPIFDFDLATTAIGGFSNNLEFLTSEFARSLVPPKDIARHIRPHYTRIDACGWDVRIPGAMFDNDWPRAIGRNEPCICMSGLKFKKCCG